MRLDVFAPLLFALAPLLPAQSAATTLPMGYEWIEGSGNTDLPHGLIGGRYQQVWPTSHVSGPQVKILQGLAVRCDATAVALPAFGVECEWALSTTAATPDKLSTTFAANQGPAHTIVLARRQLAFPVWCARPFLFNKTLAPAGLLWEARVFSAAGSPGTGLKMDGFGPAISLMPPKGKSAAGCPAKPGGNPLDLTAAFNSARPTTLTLTLKEALPLNPVVLFLGLDAARFGALPLPLDLAPFGMPGCRLFVDLLLPLSGVADAAGAFVQALPIPAGVPEPRSFPFYAQAFTPAPGVNPLGLAASNGACALTQGVPQTSRIISRVSPDDPSGTFDKTLGTVVQIRHN